MMTSRPEDQGIAILSATTESGFGTAAGGFIGGPLLESAGGRGLFLIFGLGVLLITALISLIHKQLPAEHPQESLAS